MRRSVQRSSVLLIASARTCEGGRRARQRLLVFTYGPSEGNAPDEAPSCRSSYTGIWNADTAAKNLVTIVVNHMKNCALVKAWGHVLSRLTGQSRNRRSCSSRSFKGRDGTSKRKHRRAWSNFEPAVGSSRWPPGVTPGHILTPDRKIRSSFASLSPRFAARISASITVPSPPAV